MITNFLLSKGITTLIVFLITFFVLKLINKFFKKADSIHLKFFQSILQVVVIIIGIYTCLSIFDVTKDISKTLLQSGTLIIAIATFAAQQALGNVISGFSIAFTKPFEVGQKVKVMNGTNVVAEGIIENITLRHTMVKQFDGQVCIVPNSIMDSSVIVNTNYIGDVGNYFEVEIGYDADIEKAKEILLDIYKNEELTIKKDKAIVFVSRFTANGLILKITVWTKTLNDNFIACSNMRKEVVLAYKEANITIPYNTITISNESKK